jgi:hypothetical protein
MILIFSISLINFEIDKKVAVINKKMGTQSDCNPFISIVETMEFVGAEK